MDHDLRPVVISGPSGVGKGTLIRKLKEDHPGLFAFAVSHTTRKPRHGEVDGVSYYFISPAEFADIAASDGFVEHTAFSGAMYGTSKNTIAERTAWCRAHKSILILDIDLEGIKQLKRSRLLPDARYIFIRPTSLQALETRLRGRGTETGESIQQRMAKAEAEMEHADAVSETHDVVIVSDEALYRNTSAEVAPAPSFR